MEFLTEYKEQVILVASFLTLPFFSFMISLAVVYLLGRMWDLVKANRPKNVIAFVVMVGVYLFYFSMVDLSLSIVQRVWYGIVYTSCSIILYVLFGFKLYDRMDELQDRKIGHDKPVKAPAKPRRTKRGL